jgi:hypothetical protein
MLQALNTIFLKPTVLTLTALTTMPRLMLKPIGRLIFAHAKINCLVIFGCYKKAGILGVCLKSQAATTLHGQSSCGRLLLFVVHNHEQRRVTTGDGFGDAENTERHLIQALIYGNITYNGSQQGYSVR